ncbi:13842_t:CDS:2 [Entrophospora sp. SA101]|nr:13842_t:CDS:2 [Entrophospora sp. SA101]
MKSTQAIAQTIVSSATISKGATEKPENATNHCSNEEILMTIRNTYVIRNTYDYSQTSITELLGITK